MTLVNAISYSVVHAAAGVVVGGALQTAVPRVSEVEQPTETLKLAVVQAVLNGLAVFAAGKVLDSANDPTAGILFTWALIVTQPTLSERMRALSGHAGAAVLQLPQKAASLPAARSKQCD